MLSFLFFLFYFLRKIQLKKIQNSTHVKEYHCKFLFPHFYFLVKYALILMTTEKFTVLMLCLTFE